LYNVSHGYSPTFVLCEIPCRVIGPAMPSAEMLEAAAKLTEAEAALRFVFLPF